jgi:hypothetical protein
VEGVAAERALGRPDRPRFDHVAVTAEDFGATRDHYAPFDFVHIGTLHQASDPRGFEIGYLKGGDTVLEIFTFEAGQRRRAAQLDAPGFCCATLHRPAGHAVGATADGATVFSDSDGFLYTVGA